jgi:hypothetical protein
MSMRHASRHPAGWVAVGVIAPLAALFACGSAAYGQDTEPVQELANPTSMGAQRFGSTFGFGLVGLAGGPPQQVVAVGSPWANVTLPDGEVTKAGCITLFKQFPSAWIPTQGNLGINLVAPVPQANANFGQSVSMSGSFMVVGAPGTGPPLNSGRAFLYEWGGGQACGPGDTSEWCLRAVLSNSDLPPPGDPPAAVDLFGASVANLGAIVAVSAPSNDVRYPSVQFPGQTVSVMDCGSVTMFAPRVDPKTGVRSWRAFAYVSPPVLNAAGQPDPSIDPSTLASGFFGSSIAMNGSTLVVGSKRATVSQPAQGAVYVYDFDPVALTVTYRQRLHAPASLAQANEQAGSSVASQAGRIVAGAPNRSGGVGLGNQGTVYIFERQPTGTGAFVFLTQIQASDAQAGDLFGAAVTVRDSRVVVGAPGKDFSSDIDRGSAYVFAQAEDGCSQWRQVLRLSPNLGSGAAFGSHVGLSAGAEFAVGAPGATSPAGPGQGKVLIFERDLVGCPHDLNGDGTTDGLDLALALSYWGPVFGSGYYADYNADGVIDGYDLTHILANWGPCPCVPTP